ncbi:fluoride export protein 1 [Salvia splendens]|uniref:fluoride export protein 1 n=1 Tax=Salvia splendens TaxID=180675 RepID=UPI001C263062|nr:fluoride export protein 1 [Salvia splendens]XP_042033283.1 fluoride export protein 1 [Salvia splendens]XP_042033284.1 fluoride export protein 1 [Salvia splendens]XP_042033285.1 fluoride export protein 1 [Salvia splendens]XP_042033286.1 fluoride export protein 1 [Salvia splendens]XP_042033287.1 fluoride export protein 1 [Salvia splendens]XP_042033288.1 fluoride export protein 1 [Salvia splendens]
MDHQNPELESRRSGSFGRLSAVSSSRRCSLSTSFSLPRHADDAIESESVSEVGDIGDRALHSNRVSASGRSHFSLENFAENGAVVPVLDDNLLQPYSDASFHVAPDLENLSPLSIDAMVQNEEKKIDEKEVPWLLEYTTCLLSLAVFGILGILVRYGLQNLFGPDVIGATSDRSYMYPDLPSNMVGSFLMGWFGVVFKPDIMKVSDQLSIGLSTGFLGSLTTFSGWNQKMLDLSVNGEWVFAVLGVVIGLFLVAYSIIFGIETAKGLKWLLQKRSNSRPLCPCFGDSTSHKYSCLTTFMVMLLLVLALLWSVFGALEKREFDSGSSEAQLFLACMVGPLGVWIRWYLARLNGRGLGRDAALKWMPFGTLAANVSAACVMAALATLKKAVRSKECNTVASGVQLGLLGCLSTVSTFVAEFHAMRESKHPWRAYAYAAITIVVSFTLGTLIYSVPVWVRGYD